MFNCKICGCVVQYDHDQIKHSSEMAQQMSDTYIADWCYKQTDIASPCTAPIINGVPLCEHSQPEKDLNNDAY